MKYLNTITNTSISISIFLLIVLAPILIHTYTPQFYEKQFESNSANEILGKERTQELTSNIISYLQGNKNLDSEFSHEELLHMQDVQKIYLTIRIIIIVSAIILLFSTLLNNKSKYFQIKQESIRIGSFAALVLVLFIAIVTIIDFSSGFTAFHSIFFEGDSWLFPINSLLMTLFYPPTIFIEIIKYSFITTTIISLLLITLTYMKGKNRKKRKVRKKN